MIRFLLVLLALVSALLAFIFQETMLFVASGGLLIVSVVLLLLQVLEQSKRKNRLKLPNELTPEDELRTRGVLDIRPKATTAPTTPAVVFAPPELTATVASEEELRANGIFEVREKPSSPTSDEIPDFGESVEIDEPIEMDDPIVSVGTDEPEAEIPWSLVSSDERSDLFSESDAPIVGSEVEDEELDAPVVESGPIETADLAELLVAADDSLGEVSEEHDVVIGAEVDKEIEQETDAAAPEEIEAEAEAEELVAEVPEEVAEAVEDATAPEPVSRRRVEVDAHLPALQTSLGAHTICLIDVDTDASVYRLRSIVSAGLVDHARTEYPFAGFFLSDLLAETTVLDIGPTGLSLPDLRYHRDIVQLKQVIAAPVMKDGLPAAFLVAGFENIAHASCKQAVTRAAAFFSSLYAIQEAHPPSGDSPLVRAKRKPPSLRLVKSNPKSSQSKIIAEEMSRARGKSHPLAFALVCLDKSDEIASSDQMTVFEVEEWMRNCLEQVTPNGRIEYLGELGYGILQLQDVPDVEGWVRRAQHVFRSQHGPVDAYPIVGVAMLSEGHADAEDLQADAVRALRAAYETGDSTILVG